MAEKFLYCYTVVEPGQYGNPPQFKTSEEAEDWVKRQAHPERWLVVPVWLDKQPSA